MLDLGDDDGFLEIRVGEAGVRFDLYEASNRCLAAVEAHPEDGEAQLTAILAYMGERGLPAGLSLRAAQRFSKAVSDRVEALRGKDSAGAKPASAGSTASPSSD